MKVNRIIDMVILGVALFAGMVLENSALAISGVILVMFSDKVEEFRK